MPAAHHHHHHDDDRRCHARTDAAAATSAGLAVAGLSDRRLRLFARAGMGGGGGRRHATATTLRGLARRRPDATAAAGTTRSCCATPIAPRGDRDRAGEIAELRRGARAVARAPRRDARPGRAFVARRRRLGIRRDCLPDAIAYPVAVGALAGRARHRRGRTPRRPICRPSPPTSSRPRCAWSRSARPTGQRVLAALEPVILAGRAATRDAPRSTISAAAPSAPTSPRCATKPSTRGCSAHDHISATARCASASAARSAPARPR